MSSNFGGTSFQAPNGEQIARSRTIDLYSRAVDGSKMVWKRAVQVEPVTAFERSGRWIKSGHYIIYNNGDAIVVHCGNVSNGCVSVQFMHEEETPCVMARGTIESMLLGKVVVSDEQQAAVFEGRRLSDLFQ